MDQASPIFASVTWDPENETKQERKKWLDKLYSLPLQYRHGLADDQTENAIAGLALRFGIGDLPRIGEISRMVREIFADGLNEKNVIMRIQGRLKLPPVQVRPFLIEIKRIVQMALGVGRRDLVAQATPIPVVEAIKKFKSLSEKEITAGQIWSGHDNAWKPATARNWIEDYIEKRGSHSHNNLERSDYVYESENTRRLSPEDKKKVMILALSFDQDMPIFVGKEEEEIVFDANMEEDFPIDDSFLVALPTVADMPVMSGVSSSQNRLASVNQQTAAPVLDPRLRGDDNGLVGNYQSANQQASQPLPVFSQAPVSDVSGGMFGGGLQTSYAEASSGNPAYAEASSGKQFSNNIQTSNSNIQNNQGGVFGSGQFVGNNGGNRLDLRGENLNSGSGGYGTPRNVIRPVDFQDDDRPVMKGNVVDLSSF